MLLNNLDTQGKILGLTVGIHQVSLFNLETIDPYDFMRIIGLEEVEFQWRYSGETSWREPDNGNEFTEYADSIGQELRIELNVIGDGEFFFRTDDTFEYPNDDVPTNPIIDIEVLKQGSNYYSALASDYLGSVDNNILSTFERGDGGDGVEGTAALWVTEPRINKVSITSNGGKLLFWDGEKIIPLKTSAGTNQLLLNAVSDEWGFVLLDSFDADSVSTVTVDEIEWLGYSFQDIGRQDSTHYSLFSLGDTEADLVNGTFMVGTGTGDRAASSLGKEIIGDKQYLKPYGTEGSLVTLGGLDISTGGGDRAVSTLTGELGIDLSGLGTLR